ncbi:MAG: PQQ-binding-like beta-propeller repeat protein [Candidatus Bathyarchaeia archaeon]
MGEILKDTKIRYFVILPIVVTALSLSSVYAQGQWTWETNTYIEVTPNPVGKGQSVNILVWLDHAPPQTSFFKYVGWNYTISIIDPTGKTIKVGPIESDPVGTAYYVFTPEIIGTYKIQCRFEGSTVNVTAPVGLMLLPRGTHIFKPSLSRIVELNVQEEVVEPWPEVPLPSGYWERPINAEFREWYKIAGNWLGVPFAESFINKYTKAPESPHIVWTKELTFGGIVGGEAGYGINFYTGLLYENKFTPYIIAGRLYYNMFWATFGAAEQLKGVICVDLRSGEEIWRKEDMPQISAAQVVIFNSGTQSGATAYLWSAQGSNWQVYDAYTGRLFTTITGASGNLAPRFGPNGEILVPILDGANNRLILWNSTLCFTRGAFGFMAQTYRPYSRTSFDWKNGIQYNVSIPDVPGVQSIGIIDVKRMILVAESVITVPGASPTFVHVGYDLKTGQQIWIKNWTNVGWGAGGTSAPGLIGYWGKGSGEGVYMFFEKEKMRWHVIDITTGQQLWVTNPLNEYTKSDWSVYDWTVLVADGKLFISGQSGCVVAFDLKTGKHLWTFRQESSGLMTPYGTWPHFGRLNYADGKVYFAVTEHTPTSPIFRGYRMYCIDAETGDKLWEIPGFYNGESVAIADGYLVTYNGYDNRIYCFGKGKTAIEISVSPKIIKKGDALLIEGKVLDMSPGARGVPAVADECMGEWMKYVYMQYPLPQSIHGVTVELYAIAEDGKTISIGSATTEPLKGGIFSAIWMPPEEGRYIIIAVFSGSKSYWESYATTAVGVIAAPTEVPTPATAEQAEATRSAIEALQPLIIALMAIVIICVCLVLYDIYINRKLLKTKIV